MSTPQIDNSTLRSPSLNPHPPKSPTIHPNNKTCTLCHTPQPVLVRCQIDNTGTWHLVCPGRCWKSVSGGVENARGKEGEFPYYRYGGMWKNKHAGVSAKKPKEKKNVSTSLEEKEDPSTDDDIQPTPIVSSQPFSPTALRPWTPQTPFTRSDRATHSGQVYICRRSHTSQAEGEGSGPGEKRGYRYWKEDDDFGKDFTAEESDGWDPRVRDQEDR